MKKWGQILIGGLLLFGMAMGGSGAVKATDCCSDADCDGATCTNPGTPCPPVGITGGYGTCSLGGTNCGIGIGAACPEGYICVNGDCVLSEASPTPTPSGGGGGGGGGGTPCANASQPACSQGYCDGGKVCVSTGTSGCGCSNGFTCADVVGEPRNLVVSRVSPTSATVTWDAPWYPHVIGQRVVVAHKMTDALFCLDGEHKDGCVVDYYTTDRVGNYDVVGQLEAGVFYLVYVKFYTDVPKGGGGHCDALAGVTHLSSCLLTPNPANISIGEDVTLTSDVKDPTPISFHDSFSLRNGGVAVKFWTPAWLNPNPDTTYPYSIKVTGQADGSENVSGVIQVWRNQQWEPICGDTATVHVGCVTDAPTAPTLVYPSNGATLSTTNVTLDWNATSSWGVGCPSNNNTYRVYLGESSSSMAQIASVRSGTTASNFTGESGKTYYWRVGANNGSLETLSSIRSFTITAPIVTSEAWWQAMGAGVYAGSTANQVTIKSLLPTVNDRLILPGVGGTAAGAVRVAGWTDFGSGSVSDDGWSAKSTYKGKTMDYKYFAAQVGVTGLRRLL